MTETTLNVLRKLTAYRERRTHIFQSEHALQWFVRKHRQPLINCGALVFLTGQWRPARAQAAGQARRGPVEGVHAGSEAWPSAGRTAWPVAGSAAGSAAELVARSAARPMSRQRAR